MEMRSVRGFLRAYLATCLQEFAPETTTLTVPATDGATRTREVERRFRWHKGTKVLSDVGTLRGHDSEVSTCMAMCRGDS